MTPIQHALDAQKHLQDMFDHELHNRFQQAHESLQKCKASLDLFGADMAKEQGYRGADFDVAAVTQYRYDNHTDYMHD